MTEREIARRFAAKNAGSTQCQQVEAYRRELRGTASVAVPAARMTQREIARQFSFKEVL